MFKSLMILCATLALVSPALATNEGENPCGNHGNNCCTDNGGESYQSVETTCQSFCESTAVAVAVAVSEASAEAASTCSQTCAATCSNICDAPICLAWKITYNSAGRVKKRTCTSFTSPPQS